jgi:predicted transcriptional regulator
MPAISRSSDEVHAGAPRRNAMKAQAILSEGGYCTPQTTLAEASRIMRDRNRQWLPLIGQEGKAVDVITDRDICMAVANRCLPDMTIADAMAPVIAVVPGNPTLRTALIYKWTEP